ncbi:Asp-tRNA(Asn)/Glu-tRNA(Gln) amidotransferase subunit GatB [Larkinella rosea]|uniref:Aspartyl/glutamyl-tRNA(Asn/Gln) amidotransferase subunit B n=1 Tax=Larkinella rosea TaxID=2025312 RepID=A0A3P1BDY9_9BACT|nr:Asp-tRNA(Asn)/Glu-tRNA(Gln) amidotransferase subunit GatB [Larkinella rosea]RRA98723.1 Asp-tRNA(Asn)/Glu-tRNA(Gln) amidotransferase subunit GatB [Larkinella rosea]
MVSETAEKAVSAAVLAKYELVIGLEVHCQLLTATKIFAADSNQFGSDPNTNISVITLGHPGTLPKLNRRAVELAVRMGVACQSAITQYNVFARKNYFYPDLPKGYQLSQDKTPVCVGGRVPVKFKDASGQLVEKAVFLHHIHLEEDAGKSIHDGDWHTSLDYNRAGTPLIEMVTDPVIRSAEEAAAYLTEVRRLVRYLDICDGNMEEGSLRCDVNISVRLWGEEEFGTKVEIKNMNSIRNVQRAIETELRRQVETIENGGTIVQETRMFDANTGLTHGMRMKETMNDYRYFPDPDLSPVIISDEWLAAIRAQMPALPKERFEKLLNHYGLPEYDATLIADVKELADYFEAVCQQTTNYKAVSNWIMGPVKAHLTEKTLRDGQFSLSAGKLSELINLVDSGKVSFSTASQRIFPVLIEQPEKSPEQVAQEQNLLQNSNTDALQTLVNEVLAAWPDKVKEYKKGKKGLLGLFVGEVMKKSKGSADPKLTNELLQKALSSPL